MSWHEFIRHVKGIYYYKALIIMLILIIGFDNSKIKQ